jgi:hypothetical protein
MIGDKAFDRRQLVGTERVFAAAPRMMPVSWPLNPCSSMAFHTALTLLPSCNAWHVALPSVIAALAVE